MIFFAPYTNWVVFSLTFLEAMGATTTDTSLLCLTRVCCVSKSLTIKATIYSWDEWFNFEYLIPQVNFSGSLLVPVKEENDSSQGSFCSGWSLLTLVIRFTEI